MLVYGDMGKEGGSPSLPLLYKEAASGEYTAVLHVGDFAYDLDSDGGEVGAFFVCVKAVKQCNVAEWR